MPHDPFGEAIPLERIQAGAARNVAVSALARGGVQGLQLLTVLVLARLLTPADFGVVAMAASTIGVADLFRDLGLSAATMRLPQITRSQVNTLFWINLSCGAALTLVGIAVAPLLPRLLANPHVGAIAAALSLNFVINGAAAQHLALLRRSLRFAEIARISLVNALVGSAVALALALAGAAFWALVASTLCSNLLLLAGAWRRSGFTPAAPAFDPSVRPMIAFGGNLVVFGLLGYAAQNLQNVLVGRFRGAAAAGLYSRATALINLPLGYLVEPLRNIAPATLSRLGEGSAAWRDYYLDTLRWLVPLVCAGAAVLVVASHDLVDLLLGPRWHASGDILRWLAVALPPQVLCSTTGWLYLSRGDSRGMMRWGIVGWSVVIVAMLCGLPWGPVGVARLYAVALYAITVPCFVYACRGTPLTVGAVLAVAWRPVAAAALAAAAGAALGAALEPEPLVLRLAAICVVTPLAYIVAAIAVGMRAELQRIAARGGALLRAARRPA